MMTEDEARAVITAIVGPIDRPWDARYQQALAWAVSGTEREAVREAGETLGLSAGEA